MRSAVAGRHVLWRSQLSRSPTAACGGHPQRSSRIAAAACARRAPCEPFEAAPSFLCHGVDAARQLARCPAIANFTLLATRGVASYCVILRAVANWSIWPARTADQESGRADAKLRRRKRAVEDYIARPMAAARPKNASEARRARRKYHHRSADEPYHRPLVTRTTDKAP